LVELAASTEVQTQEKSRNRELGIESIASVDEAVWREEKRRGLRAEERKETSEDSGGRSKLISAPRQEVQRDEVEWRFRAFCALIMVVSMVVRA